MAAPRYTEQQARAILTQGVSIALSAGAGCGKTFVLTQRFLTQLEPGPTTADLETLVAITFTDRAAREMRDRVREACHQRLETCTGDELDHWVNVLRGLDTARISTIHSFCTSLLRANAVEAGLDPRFGVLEPPLADALLNSAAEQVVHQWLIDDHPAATACVLRFGLERTREFTAQLVRQRFRIDWDAWQEVTPEQLRDLWWTTWQTVFVPRLIDEFRTGSVVTSLRELLAEHQPDHAEMQRRWESLAASLHHELPWSQPLEELQAVLGASKVQGGGGKSAWSSEDVYEAVKETLTGLRDEVKALLEQFNISPDDVELSATFACHAMQLARETAVTYETLKAQAGTLDFDDLLLKARDLLHASPAVRDRFARGIRLLMVDEFQDTDPVQAEIVRYLCGAALQQGKLFLVGDVKQSIYRFRRADPQVFHQLRGELPETGQLSLTRNFRSQPAILNFVNVLFATEFPQYEALVPFHNQQLSPLPAVEFLFADRAADSSEAVEDKPNAETLREWEADWMARRIVELLADDTPRVRDKDAAGKPILRRVRPGDITILFRALTSVQQYEAALRDYDLEYYLVGGKAFFAQQEVFDLLNLCRCLDDPADTVSLIGVLRSPLFGLSDDAIQTLQPRDGDWFGRLREPPDGALSVLQQERIRFAGETLHDLRAIKNRVSIAELLETTIQRTGYDAALLAEFLGNRKVANLRKLIDQASTFDRSELFTLSDYIERLQSAVLEETDEEFATTLPESGNVIRLMSIHQSKGLEFPVVIVADINRKGPPRAASVSLHPDWGALVKLPDQFGRKTRHLALEMLKIQETAEDAAETLRLLYVAVTRAADHLILSAGMNPQGKLESPWMQLLAKKFNFQTGQLKGDPLLGTLAGVSDRNEVPDVKVHREPPFATRVKGFRETISLEKLLTSLQESKPELWPESLAVFPIDRAAPATWSVSRLEELDARLQTMEPMHAAEGIAVADPRSTAEAIGNLVHAVLERLDFAQPDDWEALLATCVQSQRPTPDENVQQTTGQMLARFVASPLCEELAQSRQIFRELDFVLPWPANGTDATDLIAGQIDLCLQTASGHWRIYDYKTTTDRGRKHDAAHLAPYEFQLGVYALALEAWFSQPVEQVSLVLLRPKVREIRLAWNDRLRQALRHRITTAVAAARMT